MSGDGDDRATGDGRGLALQYLSVTAPSLLDGATYKVARARDQIEQLYAEMKPDQSNYYHRGLSQFSADRTEHTLDAVISDTAFVRWGVMTGEIVHNLRSALDLMLCALVRLSVAESDCAGTEFPIRSAAPPAGEHLKELKVVKNPDAVVTIEAHQPYTASDPMNHPLWLLNKLNNWDKHRVLQVGFLEFVVPEAGTLIDYQVTRLKDGLTAHHIVVKYPQGWDTAKYPTTPVVVFAKPGPAYADPVTWRLRTIHDEVKAVLTDLGLFF